MKNIKSRKSYALVYSGLKFTHYSYECKKHKEQEKVTGVHRGHSFPISSFSPLGQHLIASVLVTVGLGILFQIFVILREKKKSWCLFCIQMVAFQELFKLFADKLLSRGGAQRSFKSALQEAPSLSEGEKQLLLTLRFVYHFPGGCATRKWWRVGVVKWDRYL